jgi:hypothetical protein
MQGKVKSLSNGSQLRVGQAGVEAESSWQIGVGLLVQGSRIALHETMYDSKDYHSRDLFKGTQYDVSSSWIQQLGNKVAILHTPGYGYIRVSAGKAFMTSQRIC